MIRIHCLRRRLVQPSSKHTFSCLPYTLAQSPDARRIIEYGSTGRLCPGSRLTEKNLLPHGRMASKRKRNLHIPFPIQIISSSLKRMENRRSLPHRTNTFCLTTLEKRSNCLVLQIDWLLLGGSHLSSPWGPPGRAPMSLVRQGWLWYIVDTMRC